MRVRVVVYMVVNKKRGGGGFGCVVCNDVVCEAGFFFTLWKRKRIYG